MSQNPFLEKIRHITRTKHNSIQTEKTYLAFGIKNHTIVLSGRYMLRIINA